MPSRLFLCSLIPVLVLAASGQVVQAEEQRQLLGLGSTQTCGTWIAERKKAEPGKLTLFGAAMASWSLGFVSGRNLVSPGPDVLKQIDAEAIWTWLDNYCAAHPSEKLVAGLDKLGGELLRRTSDETRQ